jgi:hypothetical protein
MEAGRVERYGIEVYFDGIHHGVPVTAGAVSAD